MKEKDGGLSLAGRFGLISVCSPFVSGLVLTCSEDVQRL